MPDLPKLLDKIGLRLPPQTLSALLTHAAKSKLSPTQILEAVCEAEVRERDARNLQRRQKAATIGSHKPLDLFDWNHPRSIDRELFEHLHQSLDFVDRGENVLLRGPTGIGKTTLAQHLGMRALERGMSVQFSTLPTTLADLLRQESLPATERRLRRYVSPDLLILDELGYVPCDARAADLFFHIVSRRHERKSIVITTNLSYKLWASVFPDATCLGAIVDRFAHHCHTLDVDADSWRNTEALQHDRLNKSSRTKSK